MRLTRLTAPAVNPVTAAEVWDHLRLTLVDNGESPSADEPVDESLVDGLIATAVAWLDGADGKLRRAIITQQWKMTLDWFPTVIEVPLPPLQSVESIKYVDTDGVLQTLAAEDYAVYGIGAAAKAEITPAYGESWPSIRNVREAVRVEFTAGYGDAATDVPAPIRHAIKLLCHHLYEHPAAVTDDRLREMPMGLVDMIGSLRAWP